MKILIAGGAKTQNIVSGLERKFKSGGIDFIVVNDIEDIEDIFARGEYYDRAIIIEQCWNRDFSDTDEGAVRRRINDFANNSSNRKNVGVDYIFLTRSDEVASQVHEEILSIRNSSVIVVKEPSYTVSFFASLVTCDIGDFPDELVYETYIENEHEGYEGDCTKSDESNDRLYNQEYIDDMSKELFQEDTSEELDNWLEELGDGIEVEEELENCAEAEYEVEVEEEFEIEETELFQEDTSEELDNWLEESATEIEEDELEIEEDELEIEEDELEIEEDTVLEKVSRKVKIDESLYENSEASVEDETLRKKSNASRGGEITADSQVKMIFEAFANRGNSIAVTGSGGSGTSTVAYNIANTIANIGYTVLLVDMDTEGRTQSYISKDNYDSIEHDGANLLQALKSTSGINAHVSIISPGFRLLSMGIGGDIVKLEDIVESRKLNRFINLAKTNHNFVIYDIPFKDAIGCASDVVFMADNVVVVADSSDWGITKTMVNMCNIEEEDTMDTIFSKGQLLFNRYRPIKSVMGKKIKKKVGITNIMDTKVQELIGIDPGYYFQDMHICGAINYDERLLDGWYSRNQFSNTEEGRELFIELIKKILLKA